MARKPTDQERKDRRADAAVKFVLGRYPALKDEFAWATSGKALPKSRARPPDWVRQAILGTNRTAFAPIVSRDPQKLGNATYGNLLQLTGMICSELGVLIEAAAPPKTGGIDEKEFAPYLRQLVKGAEKQIEPKLKQYVQATKKLQKALVPAGTKQFQENAANILEGATALMTADGEFAKGRSVTAQLYMVLWLFWPHLKFADTAKEMHTALAEFTDLKFTVKLVEKVCTELGVFRGKVGRPRAKKFLPAARGA